MVITRSSSSPQGTNTPDEAARVQAPEVVPPVQAASKDGGRGRGKGRGRGGGRGLGKGRGRGGRGAQPQTAAQERGTRGATEEVQDDDLVPEDPPVVSPVVSYTQGDPFPINGGFITTPVLQDTLVQILGFLKAQHPQGVPVDPFTSRDQARVGIQTPVTHTPEMQAAAGIHDPDVFVIGGTPQTAGQGIDTGRLHQFKRLNPPTFSGTDASADPLDFIETCEEILSTLGFLQEHGVEYTAFQLRGHAKAWWKSFMASREARLPKLTWTEFVHKFYEVFLPMTLKDEKRRQFEKLRQGDMTVTQYYIRFTELSRFGAMLIPTMAEQVKRFIEGLSPSLKDCMARDVGSGISFEQAVETARRIEGYRIQDREERDSKKPRGLDNYYGASTGGKGSQSRFSDRQVYSTSQRSQVASMTHQGQNQYAPHSQQGHFQRPYQAQPYHPSINCHHCKEMGHFKRDCPRLHQVISHPAPQSQALTRTPSISAAPLASRGPPQPGIGHGRGGGGYSRRGYSSGGRLGGGYSGGGRPQAQNRDQLYALPARQDAVASNAVVTDTIPSTSEPRG